MQRDRWWSTVSLGKLQSKKTSLADVCLNCCLISKDKCKLIYYIIRSHIISYTVAFKCASINMFSPLLCVQRMYYFQTLWLILLLWLYSSFPSIFPKYNLYLDHYTRHLSLYPIEKKVLFLFSHTEVRLTNLKVKNVHSNYIFYIVLQRYSWLQTKHQILVDLECSVLKSMNPSINESFIWLCQMLKTITIHWPFFNPKDREWRSKNGLHLHV